jgi:hypothetical protein
LTPENEDIPEEILLFIRDRIDSVEQLQILLLLVEQQSTEWSVEALSGALRSTTRSVEKRLKDLLDTKVLAPEAFGAGGVIRYAAYSPEAERATQELAAVFKKRPHTVIALIFTKPPAALQSFANAFKLKKEDS